MTALTDRYVLAVVRLLPEAQRGRRLSRSPERCSGLRAAHADGTAAGARGRSNASARRTREQPVTTTPGHGPPAEVVAHRVGALLGREVRSVALLGAGTDHVAYAVDDDLVARIAHDADGGAGRLDREAALVALVAAVATVAVPEVVASAPEAGVVVVRRVPGTPVLDARSDGAGLVEDLAGLLQALHELTPRALAAGLVDRDDHPLTAFRDEAADSLAAVAGALTPRQRQLVEDRLVEPLPPEPARSTLCHNDLGAEHLLVDPVSHRLTGVIDWSDAAVTDPARDLGRLRRDLGPEVVRGVVARLPVGDDPSLEDRTRLHACWSLLEDLAFGLEHDRRYAGAALRHLDRTFAAP
jgi:aminoglycoside phosphotransferase (APT) family kinase protein